MHHALLKLGFDRLNLARPIPASTGLTRDASAEPDATTIRVLLADGHSMVRQGLAALLTAEPDVDFVTQVGDGEAAWQAIQTQEPDVAILDLLLTKASGIEIARRVDTAPLGTRCLMLATHEDPTLASQALRAGASGYVLKENKFEELKLAMRSIHLGGTFVSPAIAIKLRALRRHGNDTAALSLREREVVRLLAAGKSSKGIARVLAISPQTVDTHRRRLMRKPNLHSAAEVVRFAVQSGLAV